MVNNFLKDQLQPSSPSYRNYQNTIMKMMFVESFKPHQLWNLKNNYKKKSHYYYNSIDNKS